MKAPYANRQMTDSILTRALPRPTLPKGTKALVRLSCGHQCVAMDWIGDAGGIYCCDACSRLANIEAVEPTDRPESDWKLDF
jgi:hypothetical protein